MTCYSLFRYIALSILFSLLPLNNSISDSLIVEEGDKKDELTVVELIKQGEVYQYQGDFDRAFRYYNKAIKVDKKDYKGYFALANLMQKSRDFESAEDNFIIAMELSPLNPVIHNNFAWLYIETGRPSAAANLILEVLGRDADRNYIYEDTLATAYVKMRDFISAKQHYREALNYIPIDDIESQLALYSHIRQMYQLTENNIMVLRIDEILRKLELGHPATMLDLGIGGLE